MKAGFGLAGLLITIGVIVWFMGHGGLQHTHETLKAGDKARSQVNQIAGNDPSTGQRASQSADLQPVTDKGRLTGILVTRVDAEGAYGKYFGLQRNDLIVGVEYQGFRQTMKDLGTETDAKLQVDEAFRRQGSLTVLRNDKEMLLPPPPAPGAAPRKDGIQQQLDAIKSLPR